MRATFDPKAARAAEPPVVAVGPGGEYVTHWPTPAAPAAVPPNCPDCGYALEADLAVSTSNAPPRVVCPACRAAVWLDAPRAVKPDPRFQRPLTRDEIGAAICMADGTVADLAEYDPADLRTRRVVLASEAITRFRAAVADLVDSITGPHAGVEGLNLAGFEAIITDAFARTARTPEGQGVDRG
ncbi:MAG: hypothetical protein ACOC0M_06755 [Halomonas sp.]